MISLAQFTPKRKASLKQLSADQNSRVMTVRYPYLETHSRTD